MNTHPLTSGAVLTWSRPSLFKKGFELYGPDGIVATMRSPRFFSTDFIVEGWNGSWTLHRPSIWRPKLDVIETGRELPFARFIGKHLSGDGTFELPKGERLLLHHDFWKGRSTVQTRSGEEVFSCQARVFQRDQVVIGRRTDLLEQWPWMMGLVWMLLVERRRHASGG